MTRGIIHYLRNEKWEINFDWQRGRCAHANTHPQNTYFQGTSSIIYVTVNLSRKVERCGYNTEVAQKRKRKSWKLALVAIISEICTNRVRDSGPNYIIHRLISGYTKYCYCEFAWSSGIWVMLLKGSLQLIVGYCSTITLLFSTKIQNSKWSTFLKFVLKVGIV